jgi:hypothetical protein
LGGIIPIRQAVEHAMSALSATVAWIGAEASKRNRVQSTEFQGGGFDQQADFPMSSVISQGNGFAIRRPQTSLGAQDQKLPATEPFWIPTHPGILRPAKDVTAGSGPEHFRGQGQAPARPRGLGLNAVNVRSVSFQQVRVNAHGGRSLALFLGSAQQRLIENS